MDIQCDHVHGTTLTWNERWFNSMFINTYLSDEVHKLKGLHNIAFIFSTINVSCLHSMPFISKFKKLKSYIPRNEWNTRYYKIAIRFSLFLSLLHDLSLFLFHQVNSLSLALFLFPNSLFRSLSLYLSLWHTTDCIFMISLADLGFLNGRMGKGLFLPFYVQFRFCGEWREDFYASSMRDVARNTWHFYCLWFHMDYYTIVIWLHECSQEQEYPLT